MTMLAVTPNDDGTIRTDFYALVVATRPDARPVIHDLLLRTEDGLRTLRRRTDHDCVSAKALVA